MKKLLAIMLCAFLVLTLSACGGGEEENAKVFEGDASSGSAAVKTLDLTALSTTMVYSEVSQMMTAPEKYVGRKVKMAGKCNLFYNTQDESKTYYACIVKDATACCSQGLEFLLKDGAEYPALDDDITVEGTFETYEEEGVKYCRIADAVLL